MTLSQMQPVAAKPAGKSWAWRFWPDTHDGAPWQVFAAAAVAALATVLTEPYAVVGWAGLLTGLAVCAAPVSVAATRPAVRRRLLRPLPVAAGVAVVALLGVGTVRDAGWLYVLCVLAAFGLGSYALAASSRWIGLLGAMVAWVAPMRGIPWLVRGAAGRGAGAKAYRPLRLFLVLLATVLLVVMFGSLFAGADAAFAELLAGLLPELSAPSLVLRGFMASCVALLTLGAAFAARVPPHADRLAGDAVVRVRTLEWAVPVGALVLLFAGFVVVQFTVLFGGDQHVQLTSGPTYAEYARRGFGHLVVVTVLTLAVLAAVAWLAPRETARQRLLMRVLAGALCVLTLVVVASALYRMHLYQEAYGFTRLRLVVTLFEVWLGALFLLILAAGVRLRGGWLPRAVVGTATAAILGLAVANPDAFIAERNVARYEQTGRIDVYYLAAMSADAAPALDRLPEPLRSCALRSVDQDAPWYARTLADTRADDLLRQHPVDPGATCP